MGATTVRIRALRSTVAGVGRELAAGEVAALDAITAEKLVSMGVAVLLDERDAPRLREAFERDQLEQLKRLGRPWRGPRAGDSWQRIA